MAQRKLRPLLDFMARRPNIQKQPAHARMRWPHLYRAHPSLDGGVLAALAFLPTSSEAVSCNLEQVLQDEAVCCPLVEVLQLWRERIAAKASMAGHVAIEAQETMAPTALFCA